MELQIEDFENVKVDIKEFIEYIMPSNKQSMNKLARILYPDKDEKDYDSLTTNLYIMLDSIEEDYEEFTIKKKNGKLRTISKPNEALADIQKRIYENILRNAPVSPCAAAYVKGKSIRDAKAKHIGQPILIKVDIKGQIVSPGIYELENGSRVIDVINKAGGLTEYADTTVINLSKKIKDEMVIIVYSKEEVADFKTTKEIEKQVYDNCIRKDEDSLKNDACIDDSNIERSGSSLVNINTASIDELKNLPGIGESKAKNIIDYRNSNGSFQSIEDLKKVDGIGDGLYDQIKEIITIE